VSSGIPSLSRSPANELRPSLRFPILSLPPLWDRAEASPGAPPWGPAYPTEGVNLKMFLDFLPPIVLIPLPLVFLNNLLVFATSFPGVFCQLPCFRFIALLFCSHRTWVVPSRLLLRPQLWVIEFLSPKKAFFLSDCIDRFQCDQDGGCPPPATSNGRPCGT